MSELIRPGKTKMLKFRTNTQSSVVVVVVDQLFRIIVKLALIKLHLYFILYVVFSNRGIFEILVVPTRISYMQCMGLPMKQNNM